MTLFDACLFAARQVHEELDMPEGKQERWRELCEMAVLESDPRRVTELFKQIDQLLSSSQDDPDADILQTGTA